MDDWQGLPLPLSRDLPDLLSPWTSSLVTPPAASVQLSSFQRHFFSPGGAGGDEKHHQLVVPGDGCQGGRGVSAAGEL